MISLHHVIKRSSDFMGRRASVDVTILISLVIIGFVNGGDVMFIVCHVTSQDHMIEVSCSNLSKNSSFLFLILSNLVVIGIAVMTICFLS